MRLRSFLIVLCFVAFSATVSIQAQSSGTASGQAPIFRANARAVAVDVVVTAGSNDPVSELQKQNFQVFEDGKPQTIDLFQEHGLIPASEAAPPQLPAHVYSNRVTVPQADAVNLLLIDSLNTTGPDQQFVHKQIADFLNHLPPGTSMAIFTLNSRLRLAQGFTSDAALLKAAMESRITTPGTTIESFGRDDDLNDKGEVSILAEMENGTQGIANPPGAEAHSRALEAQSSAQAGQRSSITLAALQQLARAMAGIPGRKNLIWFASSFPISLFPDGPNRQTLANGREIDTAVRATAELLTQSKVAVYPISAQGMITDTTMNADSEGQPNYDNFERNANQQQNANGANRASMERLAADTGGQAFHTSNKISDSLAHAIQSGSHYYTLVYTPPGSRLDGKFHRIEVKLVQTRGKLAYRRGYYADSAGVTPLPTGPLAPLLAHGMPAATQVVYQVRVLPLSPQPPAGTALVGGNAKLPQPDVRVKVDFVVNAATVDLEPGENGTHTGKLEVALVARDAEGRIANWTGQTLAISLNAEDFKKAQQAGMPIHLLLDVPQSQLFLSTGVYDLSGNKAGTLEIPLSLSANPAP